MSYWKERRDEEAKEDKKMSKRKTLSKKRIDAWKKKLKDLK